MYLRLKQIFAQKIHYRIIDSPVLKISCYEYLREATDYKVKMFNVSGSKNRCIIMADDEFYALQAAKVIHDKIKRHTKEYAEQNMGGFSALRNNTARLQNLNNGMNGDDNIRVINFSYLRKAAASNEGKTAEAGSSAIEEYLIALMSNKAIPTILNLDTMEFDQKLLFDLIAEYGGKELYLIINQNSTDNVFINELVNYLGFDVVSIGHPTLDNFIDYAVSCAQAFHLSLDNVDWKSVIEDLQESSSDFNMNCIYRYVACLVGKKKACVYNHKENTNAYEELEGLIGMPNIKESVKRTVARFELNAKRAGVWDDLPSSFYKHMIFSGNPGTGKTVVARLVAKILAENGLSNGKFMEVSRSALIGHYLGSTSLKTEAIFENIKGGVLFIDEAGSFVTSPKDFFVKEAISSIIKHLEEDLDTTVIFATYPDQVEKFLELDAGMPSRISKVLHFNDYSDEELWDILNYMCRKEHYELCDGIEPILVEYVHSMQKCGGVFGNARDVRKLFNSAIDNLALDKNAESLDKLKAEHFQQAVNELLPSDKNTKLTIGFS